MRENGEVGPLTLPGMSGLSKTFLYTIFKSMLKVNVKTFILEIREISLTYMMEI